MMLSFLIALVCLVVVSGDVMLLDFSKTKETTSYTWDLTNDPVMGGVSYSTWSPDYDNLKGTWEGSVKIVPSLNAPGFCNLMSMSRKWPDASSYTHLIVRARSTIPYKGFKVSFAADTLNKQFKCYKADFVMESNGEWEELAVPFNMFSNDWSSYTGEPITTCADDPKVCPTPKNLHDISQLGIWMEGAEGDFFFELQHIRAANITTSISK